MINKVIASKEKIDKITGKGCKDSEIINSSVIRHYNTKVILKIKNQNKGINIYSTYGKGSSLIIWQHEMNKIGKKIHLVFPSLAARVPKRKNKYVYMLSDWRSKINLK